MGTVIVYLPKLQQEDSMARAVQKKLAIPNVNVNSGQSSKSWLEIKGVLHYDNKPYIPEALRTDILEKNHDNPLAGHFGFERTLKFLSRKYYRSKMRVDIKKYVQGCDIFMSSKSKRHKSYGNMQSLSILTHKWKDLSMDFIRRLSKSEDWRRVKYDLILVIVDPLTKMIHYKPVLTTLNAKQLAEVLIKAIFKYYSLPDSIITNRGLLFSFKFWSSLCYYLNIKRQFSTAFHPQIDRQTEAQNSIIEVYL